jgi:hypothetical protein
MKNSYKLLLGGLLSLALVACSSNDDDDDMMEPETQSYRIRITNLTNFQPLSPPAAVLHDGSSHWWTVGSSATDALEKMAEGGDASALLALLPDNPQHASSGVLLPGTSEEFTLETDNMAENRLSIAGMLVNTNDAFSGVNALELDGMQSGQTKVIYTHAYDAGTEMNSEAAGTIPGPTDGGEGFNAARDDVTSVVTLHSGVVSADDGLATSVLSVGERFDNPTLRIEITAL